MDQMKMKLDEAVKQVSSIDFNKDLEFRTELISNKIMHQLMEYMDQNGITSKVLANKIGTSPSYISQLFNNTRIINLQTVAKIEIAFDIEFDVSLNSGDQESYVQTFEALNEYGFDFNKSNDSSTIDVESTYTKFNFKSNLGGMDPFSISHSRNKVHGVRSKQDSYVTPKPRPIKFAA